LLPADLLPGPPWVVPAIIFGLMSAMLALDPGEIDRRSLVLRRVRIGIALVLAASTTYATVALAEALVVGSASVVNSAGQLLRTGGLVWVELMITFAFVYWELDPGRASPTSGQR
jgi:hypothetical protein